jgi:CRP/FNR family transcriptional regulator, anaerobic regulatory protein
MNELANYIKSYFAVASDDLLEIATRFKPVELKKGNFFLRQEGVCDRLAFIQSGLMRVYRCVGDREVTQWVSTKGYFITDLASFIFETPARWNIQALTDCELFSIDQTAYRALGKIIPDWTELDKRIFNHLYMSAEERYNDLFSKQPEIFNQVSLQYLASMLGMTPETLSRLRAKPLKQPR